VVAVEMNRAIIEAVNDVFGDLTGHLDRHEKVRFVNDEARSYLARSKERFDLIQISLIDTWAATAAGAFVLSENTLYTTNAWTLFLDRMTPEGILSVSRWYGRPVPAEMYKVAALATNALRASGIPDARRHLMVVATGERVGESAPGVATLLMKRTPFTDAEVDKIEALAADMNFDVMLTPRAAADAAFVALSDERTIDAYVASFTEGDLSSPNDDRPFFFKMDAGLLNGLFAFVGTLTLAFIVVPVFLKAEPRVLRDNVGLSLAFAAIGLGFMLVEIAQMQRLFLLIASGLGSFATERVTSIDLSTVARTRLITLIGILIVVGLVTPFATRLFQGFATPVRIGVALLLLMPAGFFMGMAFPSAMKIGLARQPSMTPWLWGINGATSVTASVLAVMISSAWGISAAWWSGVVCYVLAAFAIVWSARQVAPRRTDVHEFMKI
jgi:predicted membrane-bound spermidine synthase